MTENPCSLTCSVHPSEKIDIFCTHDKCHRRFLCAKCLNSHDSSHKSSTEVFSLNWTSEYEYQLSKCKRRANNLKLEHKGILEEIENIFSNLETRIKDYLSQKKQEIITRIPAPVIKEPRFFENFKFECERVESLTKSENSVQIESSLLDKYEKFRLLCVKHNEELDKQRSKIKLVPSQVDVDLPFLLQNIDRLCKYLVQNKETEIACDTISIKSLSVDKYVEGVHESMPKSILFINERNSFAIGDKQGYLTLWDTKKHIKYSKIKAHEGYINSLKYCNTRNKLFSASSDGTIKVWDVTTVPSLKLIHNVKCSDRYLWALLLLEKTSTVYACGGEPNIKLFSLNNMKSLGHIDTHGKSKMGGDMVYVDKYNLLIVGFQNGVIGMYDPISKNEVRVIDIGTSVIVSCLAYLEKQDMFVAASDLDGKLRFWKFIQNAESLYPDYEEFKDIKLGGNYAEKIVPINNQEELLIAVGNSGHLKCLNLTKFSVTKTKDTKLKDCVGFAICSEKKKLIMGDHKSNKIAILDF